MSSFEASSDDPDDCPICLEPLVSDTVTLPCTHIFHVKCVERLRSFKIQQNCPLCRADLPWVAERLRATVDDIMCDDIGLGPSERRLRAVRSFRHLLSQHEGRTALTFGTVQTVIDAGVLPRFVALLSDDAVPTLQYEAAWALTNVASGTASHTNAVVEAGAIPALVRVLSSPDSPPLRVQATWALGNISGDGSVLRDQVLEAGAMEPILNLLDGQSLCRVAPKFLQTVAWTLSILCRSNPPPDFERVRAVLPTVARIITQSKDEISLADACWTLCYLTNKLEWNVGEEDRTQVVLDALGAQAWRWRHPVGRPLTSYEIAIQVGGVTPTRLMAHKAMDVQFPALRFIGNIAAGNDAQTQIAVVSGALPVLRMLLHHPKWKIKREAIFTISNIAGGTQEQVQAVIDADIVFPVLEIIGHPDLNDKSTRALKKEAAWVILNCVNGGSAAQRIVVSRHAERLLEGIRAALAANQFSVTDTTDIIVPSNPSLGQGSIVHLLPLWASNAVNQDSSELIELKNAVLAWQCAHEERINDYELLRIIAGVRCGRCNAGHHVLTTRSGESGGAPATGASA